MREEVYRKVLREDMSQKDVLIIEEQSLSGVLFLNIKNQFYGKDNLQKEVLYLENEISLPLDDAIALAKEILAIQGRKTNDEK